MGFEVVGEIGEVETIVAGRAIRQLRRLRKAYGGGGGESIKDLRRFAWPMVESVKPSSTGTKPTEWVVGSSS